MNSKKLAFILRGIPGTGKSTFASFISALYSDCAIHAVDDLHVDDNGNFLWSEPEKASRYNENYLNFINSCDSGISLVLCDCINTKFDDVQKYVDAAKSRGYIPYVISTEIPQASVSVKRNLHGVDENRVLEIISEWQSWP